MKKFKVQIMENIEYPTHNKGNKNKTTLIFSRKIEDGACGYRCKGEEKRRNQNLQSRQMSPNMEEHRLTHE